MFNKCVLKIKKHFIKEALNNRGSALVMVILVIGLVTSLATVAMSAAVINHKIHATDHVTKNDFYYAEKALNDIYNGIGKNSSLAIGTAYDLVSGGVKMDASGTGYEYGGKYDYTSGDKAYAEFKKIYLNELKGTTITKAALTKSIVEETGVVSTTDAACLTHKYYVELTKEPTVVLPTGTDTKLRIKDITVRCTDNQGYESVISTDIVIEIPDASFYSVNESPLDYALIANKGIDITEDVSIKGNLYAGNIAGTENGLVIESGKEANLAGNFIVSKGDILLKDGSKLNIGAAAGSAGTTCSVWFENLKSERGGSAGATFTSDENTSLLAAGDLELNNDNTKVTIKGSYYGYNDEKLADDSYADTSGNAKYQTEENNNDTRQHSRSSAIIVNGKHCTLDMSSIKNLLLMGRAYIDFNILSKTGGVTANDEQTTGESIGVKNSQELYLIPSQFIVDSSTGISYPNPVNSAEAGNFFENHLDTTAFANWFGVARGYVNGTKAKTVTVNGMRYGYLVFNTDASGKSLAGEFYHYVASAEYDPTDTVSPTAYELKGLINSSLGKNSDGGGGDFDFVRKFPHSTAGSNIYVHNGGLTYYDGDVVNDEGFVLSSGSKTLKFVENTAGFGSFSGYPGNLWERYKYLYTYLYNFENKSYGAPINNPGDLDGRYVNFAADSSRVGDYLPAAKYVVFENRENATYVKSTDDADANSGFGDLVILDNPSTPYEINSSVEQFIICKGDLKIKFSGTDPKLSGMVMCSGKITIEGEGTIESNNSLLQKRIAYECDTARDNGGKNGSNYVINYLVSQTADWYAAGGNPPLLYSGLTNSGMDIISEDYSDFVYYENWRKGE